jgi:uncharacterized protein YndB with AHSA1/START domain
MPVQIDADGRRYVQAETEVPGTPEQVWDAIASGPGISSWFVPSAVDGRVGGEVRSNFGPGMESVATIAEWNPPHRFTAESHEDLGPDEPASATEWTVEARGGGTCVVRVVHRWFATSDTWDDQFEGHTYGWQSFFRVLRAYLTHFAGQRAAAFQVMGIAPEPKSEAWAALTRPLGLADADVGTRVTASDGRPPLAGVVEWAGQPAWPEELLLRLDEPAPGIAHLVAHPMDQVYLTIRVDLFGERAPAAAERAESAWRSWIEQRFPVAAPT